MKRGHSLDVIMTMVLFGVFAVSILMVLMMGAQSYQGVVTSMKESYEEGTCLQYMATKITHYSGSDAVAVGEFGDGSALLLNETIDGCQYTTYIYLYQGQVMELFCEQGVDLEPEAGFFIMDVEGLTLELVSPQLLSMTCTGSGGTAQLYVALCLGEGGIQ